MSARNEVKVNQSINQSKGKGKGKKTKALEAQNMLPFLAQNTFRKQKKLHFKQKKMH